MSGHFSAPIRCGFAAWASDRSLKGRAVVKEGLAQGLSLTAFLANKSTSACIDHLAWEPLVVERMASFTQQRHHQCIGLARRLVRGMYERGRDLPPRLHIAVPRFRRKRSEPGRSSLPRPQHRHEDGDHPQGDHDIHN